MFLLILPMRRVRRLVLFAVAVAATIGLSMIVEAEGAPGHQTQQSPSPSPASRTLGTIQSIAGNNITLTTQGGTSVAVTVQDGARVLRIEPGEKDLKNATPITLQDLQVGDRILIVGKASDDTKSFVASSIVAMKKMDIEAKQQKDRDDWQKRGVGGLVTSANAAAGTITISVASLGGPKPLIVQVSKDTVLRRYAPDSVKFDDAKRVTLEQIKPGDQLRARGTRSDDGTSLAAEEIVAGSFRNIAGTISSIDTTANTITVMDLATKQPLTVKVTADSEVRKLPLMMAQGIAARLKGTPAGGTGTPGQGSGQPQNSGQGSSQGQGAGGNSARSAGNPATASGAGGQAGAAGSAGRRGGGAGDFQQIVNRMPPAALTDFQKGDAVMIVSTQGTETGAVTAITLLGGVEPILAATPKGGQPMALSPWSLGGGGEAAAGDAGGNP
jgi:hypothetical protein